MPLAHLAAAYIGAGHRDPSRLGFDLFVESERGPFCPEEALLFSPVIKLINQVDNTPARRNIVPQHANNPSKGSLFLLSSMCPFTLTIFSSTSRGQG